ncbi:unnamed protein product, partial [Prorocentrum cordatum]
DIDKCRFGPLLQKQDVGACDASVSTCWYQCKNCCSRFGPAAGSMLLGDRIGCGITSLTDNVLCYMSAVAGVSQTVTVSQLSLHDTVVARFYDEARRIMAADAVRRQSCICFGQLPDGQTCDVEADESQFFSWPEDDGSGT